MADSKYLDRFLGIASESCTNVFETYGVALSPGTSDVMPSNTLMLCGVIGFSGKGLRGSIILGAPNDVLLASKPKSTTSVDRHWVGELANQLIGRIQNQLMRYGVEIFITAPVTLRGDHILPTSDHGAPRLEFEGPAGKVWVWMDLTFAKGFTMLDRPDPNFVGPTEGDALLF